MDTELPFLIPQALGAARSRGKNLLAGLGNSFHSWCLCLLAGDLRQGSSLSSTVSQVGMVVTPTSAGVERLLTQRMYGLEAVSMCEQETERRAGGQGSLFQRCPFFGGCCWACSWGLQWPPPGGGAGSGWRRKVGEEAQRACDSPGATQQTQKWFS